MYFSNTGPGLVTDKARVAHVTTAHPAQDTRIFHKECVALARAGFDVHLVAVAEHDASEHGVTITALPRRQSRLGRMILGPIDAWRAIRRIRPDLLHVHDPELVPFALTWQFLRRRPAVFDAHEDLVKQIAGKAYLPSSVRPAATWIASVVESCADRWLTGVVTATPAIDRKFRTARTALVQNFPWSASFREDSELRHDQQDVIYVGALTEARGLQQMLALAEATQGEGSVVLAGPCHAELAQALSVAPGVLYRGIVSGSDVPSLLAHARVGLALLHPLPNYLDSQATKIYEYMAAGRPFVASNFPSWVAQLAPFGCGIFVDPFDGQAIARAVAALRTDHERAQSMGRKGRQAWISHFTFEPEAERLVALTRELLRCR